MTNEEMLAAIKEMFAAERTATDKKIESTQINILAAGFPAAFFAPF